MSVLDLASKASTDLTKEQASAARTPARAGPALLRFREYFELGTHKSRNPSNSPGVQAVFVFELLHPDHMLENKDGEAYPDTARISLPKGKTSRSLYYKLFKVMNNALGGQYTHFGAMLGSAFLATLVHNTVKDNTYVNLSDDNGWTIKAPVIQDPLDTAKVTKIPVPEMQGEPRFFVWEDGSFSEEDIREMWSSLYIDGTYEKDGQEHSKNWIQDTIKSATDWSGSMTESAISNIVINETANMTTEAEPEATEKELVDPLAALGLV